MAARISEVMRPRRVEQAACGSATLTAPGKLGRERGGSWWIRTTSQWIWATPIRGLRSRLPGKCAGVRLSFLLPPIGGRERCTARCYGYGMRLDLRFVRTVAVAVSSTAVAALTSPAESQQPADTWGDLVGKPARAWQAEHWINSPALELSELRGKVVLVRFWTAPDCPFCSATAPALNDFHARYASRGLRVVAFYHHKSRSPLDVKAVRHYARVFGFRFPVAIDPGWHTLRSWWLDVPSGAPVRKFTSVSFLIDRRGVIRHVHPGGQYVAGDADHERMQALIEQLCDEPQ
jgi:peroxiredoxin